MVEVENENNIHYHYDYDQHQSLPFIIGNGALDVSCVHTHIYKSKLRDKSGPPLGLGVCSATLLLLMDCGVVR